MVIGRWQVHGADADDVLAAAWELGRVHVGHLYIDAPAGPQMWWWSCCCGIAGGFAGAWGNVRLALAGFMTAHRSCVRLAAWDREETRPISYQIGSLSNEATPARDPR
jgi:hypothetical protein